MEVTILMRGIREGIYIMGGNEIKGVLFNSRDYCVYLKFYLF